MAKSVAKVCGSLWMTMVFCRSMPTTACFKKKKKEEKKKKERKTGSLTSGKTKRKDNINTLHDNVLDDRG